MGGDSNRNSFKGENNLPPSGAACSSIISGGVDYQVIRCGGFALLLNLKSIICANDVKYCELNHSLRRKPIIKSAQIQ